MKISLLAVGRLKDAWLETGANDYLKRLRGKLPVEVIEIPEGKPILPKVPPRTRLWALDERGTELTSVELANKLGDAMRTSEHGWTWVIGGADGLAEEVLKAAHFRWSLGRLTLPHRLCRIIVLEQLYRAHSILRGEPYHRP